jgi:UTP--glucose-1-phosphate uridylyltransferase
MTPKVRKAVIPAAGLGTRLLPVTKTVPKELLLVVDRPATQYAIEEAVAAGIEEIVFIISENKESIGHYFSPAPALDTWLADQGKASLLNNLNALLSRVRTRCVYQDQPRGLGHAVLCAREAVGEEPCIVILPDDLGEADPPLAAQLLHVYERKGTGVVA